MTTEPLLTLAQAAELIPGADAGTLLRRARQGKLVTYRPGKRHMTTAADVRNMVLQCRVVPKVRGCGSAPLVKPMVTHPLGSSSTDLASAALDAALATVMALKKS